MKTSFAVAALLGLISAEQKVLTSMKPHANEVNPFAGKTIFANPTFTGNVKKTEADHSDVADMLKVTELIGAANWIDTMDHISRIEPVLKGAKEAGELAMFVVYDLPNRDCAALASNGEILCEDSSCANGLSTYKTNYVDKVIAEFKKYPDVPIVAIVEPDSLPNLATNLSNPKCA